MRVCEDKGITQGNSKALCSMHERMGGHESVCAITSGREIKGRRETSG